MGSLFGTPKGLTLGETYYLEPLRRSSAKIGTIQRRLAWPLRKDDTHKSRMYLFFDFFLYFVRNPYTANQTESCKYWQLSISANQDFRIEFRYYIIYLWDLMHVN